VSYVLEVRASGSNCTAFVDGVQIGGTQTITAHQTDTYHGLYVFQSTDHLFENFSVLAEADAEPVGWLGDPGYVTEAAVMRRLSYVRARWYQAGGPGWLSQDPIGLRRDDVNLYAYVRNNPLSRLDPSGLSPVAISPCLLMPVVGAPGAKPKAEEPLICIQLPTGQLAGFKLGAFAVCYINRLSTKEFSWQQLGQWCIDKVLHDIHDVSWWEENLLKVFDTCAKNPFTLDTAFAACAVGVLLEKAAEGCAKAALKSALYSIVRDCLSAGPALGPCRNARVPHFRIKIPSLPKAK
jgi:RHS repeat-associated protein